MEEEKRPNGAVVPDLAASAGIEGGSSLALPASDDGLGRCLLQMMKTPAAGALPASFSSTWEEYLRSKGRPAALRLLSRLEVALGGRRPSLGLYDNALHFIGGAQKYGCTIAHALQDDFDITLIANSQVTLDRLQSWYDLDLSRCRLKVIHLPYFEDRPDFNGVYDAGKVDLKKSNPYHAISRDSAAYDVFVNNCMLEMVYPLAAVSELVCHFPEREISRFFHVARYSHIIYNSRYTAEWIRKRWLLEPHIHIYPPVDMEAPRQPAEKEKMILSVSRFELSGNKQQLEMIKAFQRLCRQYPEATAGWRLVLAGGSTAENPYLERIRDFLAASPGQVELKVDLPADELRALFGQARIFWHFSGLKQWDPARVEHFGMTTVEAMQNACAPVVFRGGGQTEIVEDGVSGFMFSTAAEMEQKTLALIRDPELAARLGRAALERGRDFRRDVFESKVRGHFRHILRWLTFQDSGADKTEAAGCL